MAGGGREHAGSLARRAYVSSALLCGLCACVAGLGPRLPVPRCSLVSSSACPEHPFPPGLCLNLELTSVCRRRGCQRAGFVDVGGGVGGWPRAVALSPLAVSAPFLQPEKCQHVAWAGPRIWGQGASHTYFPFRLLTQQGSLKFFEIVFVALPWLGKSWV